MLRLALLVACSCGRIGFDPNGGGGGGGGGGDGSVPSNEIEVTVVTDYNGTQAPGMPIAGATVLVDRGAAQPDRFQTDATGAVRLMAVVPTTLHVVYDEAPFGAANTFRIYTVQAIPPGTAVILGGRGTPTSHSMAVDLPTQGGTPEYTLPLPGHCGGGYSAFSSGPMLMFPIADRCIGQTAQGYGMARDISGVWSSIDAGLIPLAPASTVNVTGSYSVMPTFSVQFTNLPFMASVSAVPYVTTSDGLDLIDAGELAGVAASGSAATFPLHALAVANRLQVSVDTSTSTQIEFQTTQVRPITPGTAAVLIDTAQLLPSFTNISMPSATTATWSVSAGTPPDVLVFDGTIGATETVSWTGYLAPTATSIDFPPLPPDLAAADPTGGTWQTASVNAYGGVPATDAFAFDQIFSGGVPPDGYLYAFVFYSLF